MDDKKESAGAICISQKDIRTEELSFEEILLDERLVQGDIWVWEKALCSVGGINYRLMAKQNYELLIRIAREYKVLLMNQADGMEFLREENAGGKLWINLQTDSLVGASLEGGEDGLIEEGLKADCYLVSRYRSELADMGCFQDAALGILSASARKEDAMRYLEGMVAGNEEFYDIYDCTQPILIYTGCDLCYNILDTFSAELGFALEELGQKVEYFDLTRQSPEELIPYAKRRFKAVIGMQTNMFGVKWKTGTLIHDDIPAPKYNFLFDHPIWLRDYLEKKPRQLCALTPDGNYAKFIEEYFDHPARFLPPAGEHISCGEKQRDYEVVFLGSYGEGLVEHLKLIRNADKERGRLLNWYVLYMRQHLEETPEQAFKKALAHYGVTYTKKELIELFYRERWIITELANHYRNKVIRRLLDAGIRVHVFGDTWKDCSMWEHPALIHHPAVFGRDALEIYARAKISLNVMRWHKDGFTERIANTMLQKSVVVTDRTSYLDKNFVDGEDIILFDLDNLKGLPDRIRDLLVHEDKRKMIAEHGYQKAQRHTWRDRAAQILEMIEEDRIG
ncbi:glycosyltransferase family protein [Parablautia muri]|uniref:Glycosyltransferase family 1 protein n=1 Tax=Parablautia muri TaxID=2320879 RepID=A0A9X5BIR9_9FIRM|nr:glycosyltransferase [Parablautia muri]NBJ94861.1 glycosyltransferase family 1 protein [Parablautia muri]